jgi:putative endonuclease
MEDKHFNKVKGDGGEDLAAGFLTRNGFTVLARNFLCGCGEIDIVASKGGILHFVEVKARKDGFVLGRFAVNSAKQKHIRNAAAVFLSANGLTDKVFCSFDVIDITGSEIEFLENCFY